MFFSDRAAAVYLWSFAAFVAIIVWIESLTSNPSGAQQNTWLFFIATQSAVGVLYWIKNRPVCRGGFFSSNSSQREAIKAWQRAAKAWLDAHPD